MTIQTLTDEEKVEVLYSALQKIDTLLQSFGNNLECRLIATEAILAVNPTPKTDKVASDVEKQLAFQF